MCDVVSFLIENEFYKKTIMDYDMMFYPPKLSMGLYRNQPIHLTINIVKETTRLKDFNKSFHNGSLNRMKMV